MRLINGTERLVHIGAGGKRLEGSFGVVRDAVGVVLFAHGSGSSRHSPRNNYVASVLRKAGLSTLLMDLLTREEDMDYDTRFDIGLLSDRLVAATGWLAAEEQAGGLNIGYFGASTGAAAALQASVGQDRVRAIVSRGGRPDLAWTSLPKVGCPTLFIVGGRDEVVIELNRKAFAMLNAEKELAVVPGATHLFEEPGTLEEVAELASKWFVKHLPNQ